MPIGKVFDAREGQLLFSPVSNYYQGKAIRADIGLREKQGEALQMEIDSAPAAAEAAQREEQRKIEKHEADMAKAGRDVEEAERILGKERTADLAEASASLFMAYEDQASPEEATDRFFAPLYASPNFTPEQVDQMRATLDADKDGVISKKEAGAYKNFGMSYALRQKQEEQRGGEELTRLQDRLADPDLRPEDRAAIEARIAKLTAPALGATEYDVGSGLSKSGLNATTIKFRDKAGQAAVSAMSGVELVNISYQNPASLGKSGAIVQFGNEIYRTAKNLVELTKSPELPASETEKQDEGWTAFDFTETDKSMKKLGLTPIEATRFKAGIYSIAFSAAVGEQGTRPSDKDIQQYIKIYGGDVTGGPSFRATIAQAMERQDNTLKFMAQLNPEIQDAEQTLGVWNNAYSEFKDALGNPETKTTGPKIGDIDGGYRFIGGDPSDRDSWEKE